MMPPIKTFFAISHKHQSSNKEAEAVSQPGTPSTRDMQNSNIVVGAVLLLCGLGTTYPSYTLKISSSEE